MGVAKTKAQLRKYVHQALTNWYLPSREGTEPFIVMAIAQRHGLTQRLSIIDTRMALNRMALNRMLTFYMDQLARLQPQLSRILIRRYINQETMSEIAYKMSLSQETATAGRPRRSTTSPKCFGMMRS